MAVSPWQLDVRSELAGEGESLVQREVGRLLFSVRAGHDSLWIVVSWPSEARLALRVAHAPGGLHDVTLEEKRGTPELRCRGSLGEMRVRIEWPHAPDAFVHWQTWITPVTDLVLPFWPRDVYPLGRGDEPVAGRVWADQLGQKAAIAHLSITAPGPATILYLHDLTALNRYFDLTKTTPSTCVGGEWPELGMALPTDPDHPLPAGEEVQIADAGAYLTEGIPESVEAAAAEFLDALAEMYLQLPCPDPAYRDWPGLLEATLRDITDPRCVRDIDGRHYLRAYLQDDNSPPESMVQLAFALPLMDYVRWGGHDIPLFKELLENLGTFFDAELGTVRRWLPGVEHKEQKEEQESPDTMDSWYLYHTLLNLSRLALAGEERARELFLNSVEYAMRVARRYEYRWPVFFDLRTLDPIKSESAPGEGGEHDVPLVYAQVMLQARELTGESRFFDEAVRSVEHLRGMGPKLLYQANNTAFGAATMMRLWRETGNDLHRQLAEVCVANLIRNTWLWDCQYGHARHYGTFFALEPLREAGYVAPYEEAEVLAGAYEYLAVAREDSPASARLLLAEYGRHLLGRAWQYYPGHLPHDVLAKEPKTGAIDPALAIPLEDLHDGWEAAGQVGQEVYGAALPLTLVARCYHTVDGMPFLLFCDYPVEDVEAVYSRATKDGQEEDLAPVGVSFAIRGDPRCQCRVRLIPGIASRLPKVTVEGTRGRSKGTIEGVTTPEGHQEYPLQGDHRVTIRWRPEVAKEAGQRMSARTSRERPSYVRWSDNKERMRMAVSAGIQPRERKAKSVAGKAIVITGGTTGIGRATARLLASEGAHVLVFGREQQELQDALREIQDVSQGGEVIGLTADQSKIEDVRRVFEAADDRLGGVDILINNAALPAESTTGMSPDEIAYIVQSNLTGYLICAHQAVERMKARGGGHIVNIGSMSAETREAGSSVYVATKSGIQGFAEALRKEVNEQGIKVSLIEPGKVGTDMGGESPEEQRQSQQELSMLKAEDIAEAVFFCLTQPERVDVITVQIRPHLQTI